MLQQDEWTCFSFNSVLLITWPTKDCFSMSAADLKVTQRSFNFGKKQGLPFYFVSAADGTNVVKVWSFVYDS